jgi:hypothetical protein
MLITQLPAPPSRSDSTNFATRADNFLAALPQLVTEINALPIDANLVTSGGAALVGFTPSSGIAATNVQSAIAEIGTDLTAIQNGTVFLLSGVVGTNTITATITPAITAYVTGQTFRFVAASANTGAVTININGLGAKAITKSGATALTTGDIPIGAVVNITYDGTQFQLSSGAGGSAGNTFVQSNLTVPAGTGLALVGPLTLSGTTTISGRLVIL